MVDISGHGYLDSPTSERYLAANYHRIVYRHDQKRPVHRKEGPSIYKLKEHDIT